MTVTEKTYTVLTADEGMILTNSIVYSDKVYLGAYDSTENWVEVELTDEIQGIIDGVE